MDTHPPNTTSPQRIAGLDLARALAIIGMIVTHLAYLPWYGEVGLSGLPSTLFAVISGFSTMLAAQRPSSSTLTRLTRGLLLIILGVPLAPFAGDIQVVLVALGTALALTCWVPTARTRTQISVAVGAGAISIGQSVFAPAPSAYPISAWVSYVVFGMLLFNLMVASHGNIRPPRRVFCLATFLSVVGISARVVGGTPDWLALAGHTGGAGELLLSLAVATMIISGCLIFSGVVSWPFRF